MENRNSTKLKQKMSSRELQLFSIEYGNQRKNVGTAYILLVFLGGLGIHQVYLERKDLAGFHLFSTIFFLFSLWVSHFDYSGMWLALGTLVVACSGLKLLYDLFVLGSQTDSLNEKIEARVAESFQRK